MFKLFYNMNLMRKFIVLLIAFVVIPILLLDGFISKKVESITEEQVGSVLLQLVRANHLTLDRENSDLDEKTEKIMISQEIQQLQQLPSSSEYERFGKFNAVDEYLRKYSTNSSHFNYSFFFQDSNGLYSFVPSTDLLNKGVFYTSMSKLTWFEEAERAKGKGIVRVITRFGNNPNEFKTVAYLRQLNSTVDGNSVIGYLALSGLEYQYQQDFVLFDKFKRAEVLLLDADNLILSSSMSKYQIGDKFAQLPDQGQSAGQGVVKVTEEGKMWMYVIHASEATGTKLVLKVPVDSIISEHVAVQRWIDLIMVIYFVILIVLSVYFIHSILKPISKLARVTHLYQPGMPLSIQLKPNSKNEIVLLNNLFVEMTNRLNKTIYEKYELELEHKEIELSILHTQINPHLLYNTLESIYWRTMLEGAADSAAMIKDLSLIMRIGLSKGKLLISIGEEINHAEAYLRLQLFRYDYSFQVDWDVQEEVRNFLIPKVVLQPIIENAIVHGIKNMNQDGQLWISIALQEQTIVITIDDNGYRKANLAQIAAILRGEEKGKGYGIVNVQKRIQLHFGDKYGLIYSERPKQGVRVTIVIPAITAEE
ncbi:sensor histidine kinase [Paenibacillus athensensis]|uniref:Uncharacterized protein n=1 Tax=Paenibacillus athensensis TaxID=1967502 RepID=A0A4Y8Q5J0_9BACL|nr:sensor histidine kinase [Paenibacillus athensensis]MCD1259485.1 sensor histidine kinase [Paenibacillus athensensis]